MHGFMHAQTLGEEGVPRCSATAYNLHDCAHMGHVVLETLCPSLGYYICRSPLSGVSFFHASVGPAAHLSSLVEKQEMLLQNVGVHLVWRGGRRRGSAWLESKPVLVTCMNAWDSTALRLRCTCRIKNRGSDLNKLDVHEQMQMQHKSDMQAMFARAIRILQNR